jgi:hypothetical protein
MAIDVDEHRWLDEVLQRPCLRWAEFEIAFLERFLSPDWQDKALTEVYRFRPNPRETAQDMFARFRRALATARMRANNKTAIVAIMDCLSRRLKDFSYTHHTSGSSSSRVAPFSCHQVSGYRAPSSNTST